MLLEVSMMEGGELRSTTMRNLDLSEVNFKYVLR